MEYPTAAQMLNDLGAPQEIIDQASVYEMERKEATLDMVRAFIADGIPLSIQQGEDVFVNVSWLNRLLAVEATRILEGAEPDFYGFAEILSDTLGAAQLYVEESGA